MNVQDALGQTAQATDKIEQCLTMASSQGQGLDENQQMLMGIKQFADESGAQWAAIVGPDNEDVLKFAQIEIKAGEVMERHVQLSTKLDELTSYYLQVKVELDELHIMLGTVQ